MKNSWAAAGLVALCAFSFSSCSLEPYMITAEEQYMRDFIKKFGLVDAEQDWNMAKSEDIKVNVGEGIKHLKLYAKVGQKYYLIADYYDVEGTFDIPADVPEGTRDILAIADGCRYYGTVGTTLDCTGTGSRASGDSSDNFPEKSEITSLDDYQYEVNGNRPWAATEQTWTLTNTISTETTIKGYTVKSGYLTNESDPRAFEYFNAQQIAPITSHYIWRDYYSLNGNTLRVNRLVTNGGFGLIPEGGLNPKPQGNTNNPGIIENFTITAKDGKFAIYPMYWNTSQIHELGIYLYDEGGNQLKTDDGKVALFPIFLDKRSKKSGDIADADLCVYEKESNFSYERLTVYKAGEGGTDAIASIPNILPGLNADGLPDCITKKEDGSYEVDDQEFKPFMLEYVKMVNNPANRSHFQDIFGNVNLDDYRLVRFEAGNWNPLTFRFTFEKISAYPEYSEVASYLAEYGGGYVPAKTDGDGEAFSTSNPLLVRNRAYFVYLPDGYDRKFGMYIKFNDITYSSANSERILYSESKYNDGKSFACSFLHPESGRTFFSFEDWKDNGDQDLNGLVFRIADIDEISNDTDKITEISDDPISWIWAVEDLGSTDDFDFNDVVVRITSVTTNIVKESSSGETTNVGGHKKVTFTPLAAGGTLPTYIHWEKSSTEDFVLAPGVYVESGASTNGDTGIKPLESLNGGKDAVEYHRWFGNYTHTQMINTGQHAVGQSEIKECVIYVKSQFSIGGFANTKTIDGNGKGLYISINGPTKGENTENVDIQKASDVNYNVSAPATGAPAQMFIILDNNWAWPTERTHINLAYPRFKDWVADKSLDWTTTRGEGQVVNR